MPKTDHSSSPDHRPDFWKPNTSYSAPKGQFDPGYGGAYSLRGWLISLAIVAALILILVLNIHW